MTTGATDEDYAAAAWQVLKQFPVSADYVELVAHSENLTYRVSDHNADTDFVLRLHRPGYNTLEELESERAWTTALHEAGVRAPSGFRTRDGHHFASVQIPAAKETRFAGLTSWFDGIALCDYFEERSVTEERIRIFRRTGEIAAAIHNQATSWTLPDGFVRPTLDIDGLLGEAPHWGRFWEHSALTPGEQRLLMDTREKLRAVLDRYGMREDNFSLIHTDMNPDNLVYHEGEIALIDFDDSAFGWHMYELASALIDDRDAGDFDAVCSAMLDGYRAHRSLAEEDVAMLPTFLLIRGLAIVGWYHERPEHRGSSFFQDVKDWVIEQCNCAKL